MRTLSDNTDLSSDRVRFLIHKNVRTSFVIFAHSWIVGTSILLDNRRDLVVVRVLFIDSLEEGGPSRQRPVLARGLVSCRERGLVAVSMWTSALIRSYDNVLKIEISCDIRKPKKCKRLPAGAPMRVAQDGVRSALVGRGNARRSLRSPAVSPTCLMCASTRSGHRSSGTEATPRATQCGRRAQRSTLCQRRAPPGDGRGRLLSRGGAIPAGRRRGTLPPRHLSGPFV